MPRIKKSSETRANPQFLFYKRRDYILLLVFYFLISLFDIDLYHNLNKKISLYGRNEEKKGTQGNDNASL